MEKIKKKEKLILIIQRSLVTLLAIIVAFAALPLLGSCNATPEEKIVGEMPDFGNPITGGNYTLAAENSNFELHVIPDTGEFKIVNKNSQKEYLSNPAGREEDTIARDAWRTNMNSQIIINLANNDGNIFSEINSFVGSSSKDGLKTYLTDNGIILSYTFVAEGLTVPMKVAISDQGFSATVLMDQIHGDGFPNYLTGVTVLPFMGAATIEDEGYMLIPDGSGALINLNNEKYSTGAYSGQIYGSDASFKPLQSFAIKKNSFLPIYGIKSGDKGLFAIVTDGESLGTINANVSGARTSYNFIYSQYQVRASDSFFIPDRSGNDRENFVLDRTDLKIDKINIDYFILEGENADYMGMASVYREYLLNVKGLKATDKKTGALYLDFYGGVRKTEPKLGIPITSTAVLTSYSDALNIVKYFKNLGVNEFVVRLRNSQKQDIDKKPAKRFSLNSKLGRKSEYEDLVDEVGEGRVYLSMDPINVKSDVWLARTLNNTTQTVMGLPAYQLNYDMASGFKDHSERWYLLAPDVAIDYFAKYISGAVKSSYTSYVSVEEIGERLYSNYGESWSNTEKTKDYWVDALKNAQESGANMMIEGANSYVLPYAERLSGIPTATSNFGLIDAEIPFTQLALNGIIEYATEHINLSSNPRRSFLKAIESDSCLSYTFIEDDPVTLRDTELSFLYGSSYKGWSDELVANYKEYAEFKTATENTPIKNHEILNPGVVKVTYENGAYLVINYNLSAVTVDSKSVDAQSFEIYERMG